MATELVRKDYRQVDSRPGAGNNSDAEATRLGQKTYIHGTTYNGGIAPTVSGPAGLAVGRAAFIPYQMQDGSWRMKFNVRASITSATAPTFTINGVTFIATYHQAVALSQQVNSTAAFTNAHTGPNTSNIGLTFTTAVNDVAFSGDVELLSKPTWAY